MKLALTIGIAALLGLAGTTIFVRTGLYDVAAATQHTQPVYSLLRTAMMRSVKRRARGIEAPPFDDGLRSRGAAVYTANCLPCHGAPGVAPDSFSLGMQPVPGPLVDAAKHWLVPELYWITRNGIRMTGMPAWEYRLADEDIWAVVAFVTRLPLLSPADLAALQRTGGSRPFVARAEADEADPRRGREALHQYGCHACHVIPGITGADVHVGPPLAGIGSRRLIAGVLPNEPEQMVRWLLDPAGVDPKTAMPDLEVAEDDARDMAAYLATLRHD